MFKEDYHWNFDYVRLSLDSGFTFEKHKTENLDKSKISFVDIDKIVEERDIATVEKFLPSVIKFVLDPEQAKLLDDTFVKTFRLSQLSVEYLLFCKRYLDNSIVSLKKKLNRLEEENKELKLFVDDLKEHVNVLLNEKALATSFKCDDCNKLFSTPEFLSSHKKRRHMLNSVSNPEADADKLELAIKELKGRLNTAEKMLQEEIPKNVADTKLVELQQKFEDLRLQVQSELKVLKTQQNFEEKYEKWVERMAFSNTKPSNQQEDSTKVPNLDCRRESTTQTETEVMLNPEKNEDRKKAIEEIGMSSSLQKIEDHMQSFWQKLNEIESKREASPPAVRPRSKYTVKQQEIEQERDDVDKSEPIASPRKFSAIQKTEKVEHVEVIVQNVDNVEESSSELSSYESSQSLKTDSSFQEPVTVVPQKIDKKKPSSKSVSKKAKQDSLDDDLFAHFKGEVEKVLMKRLQDLGVSPEWKGLPTYSFNKAIEIVMHQANLLKKTYPDFNEISSKIEEKVLKDLNTKISSPRVTVTPKKSADVKKLVSVRGKKPSPPVEIKNRKIYETDSESEIQNAAPKMRENLQKFSAPYSAVIEELKTVNANKTVDTNIEEKENINKKEEPVNKGVLKNYPSVGSLVNTKKKVLFNLDNDNLAVTKNEGDSTSIASSVFDGSPRKNKDTDKKDIEDLSDFDFDI